MTAAEINTHAPGLSSPWLHSFAVTPGDTSASLFGNISRGLWVGTGGDLKVVTVNSETVTFGSVPSGTLVPVIAKQVLSTGTTASNILGGY